MPSTLFTGVCTPLRTKQGLATSGALKSEQNSCHRGQGNHNTQISLRYFVVFCESSEWLELSEKRGDGGERVVENAMLKNNREVPPTAHPGFSL